VDCLSSLLKFGATQMIEWMSAESGFGYAIGFVGDRAVYQILPQPIHAPVIWKICDPRGNLIGSAASFVDAKLWCEKRPRHGKGFRII